MTKLFQTFVKLRIIRLTPKWIEQKIESNDIDAIAFGITYGMYNVRVPSVNYLSKIDSEDSRRVLISAIDDPMKLVSETAIESLERMNCSDFTKNKIHRRKLYWNQIETEKLNRQKSKEKMYMPERKDRPSRKSFENLKQMLRKPMNSGKWF